MFKPIYVYSKELSECIKSIPNYNFLKTFEEELWKRLSQHPFIAPMVDSFSDKVIWYYLSENPNAVHILEKYPDKIDWYFISGNPNAIHIIEKNIDKINWGPLSKNSNAIHILKENIEKINWSGLCSNKNEGIIPIFENNLDKLSNCYEGEYSGGNNCQFFCVNPSPFIVSFLEKHPEKIYWYTFYRNENSIPLFEKKIKEVENDSKNNYFSLRCILSDLSSNPKAIHILEKYPDKINWSRLSSNPNAIHILEKNPDKIDLRTLVSNPKAITLIEQRLSLLDKNDWWYLSANPNAIDILEKNLDKVSWYMLSGNSNAIRILEKNTDKVDWDEIAGNLNGLSMIFNLDYQAMKDQCKNLREELKIYLKD